MGRLRTIKIHVYVLLFLIFLALLSTILSHPDAGVLTEPWWLNTLQNLSTELWGAVATFILLDLLLGTKSRQNDRDRLQSQFIVKLISARDADACQEILDQMRVLDLLRGADLAHINLDGMDLEQANLSRIHLSSPDLLDASLERANLERANLNAADLRGVNLKYASLRFATLRNAQFNAETTLPDDTKWTPQTDLRRFTDPQHPQFWEPQWAATARPRRSRKLPRYS